MEKKKYLFGFAVLMVSLLGIFGGGVKAMAYSCECGSGSPFEKIGSTLDVANANICDQDCANMGADKYRYLYLVYDVTKSPATAITVCYCKYVPTIANGDYISVGIKSSAAECKATCEKKNEIQTEIEKYCYPTKTDCKDISSKAQVGCYDATNKTCQNYTGSDKCISPKTVCPNDAVCASSTSCSSSNPTLRGCYDAIAGTCMNLDKDDGATCNAPATWCSAGCSGDVCATTNPVGNGSTAVINFFNPVEADTIDEVLAKLLTALSGLVVTLSIIFIVLGGILYMLSAGDPGMITRAKNCWLFSVIGLAIVVAAPTFLKEVISILGGSTTLNTSPIDEALTVAQIATNVLNFLLSIVGIIAIISLVIAGGMYMTAYGDDTQIGKAKKMGTYSIVGIAVALASLIAVQQISALITGS